MPKRQSWQKIHIPPSVNTGGGGLYPNASSKKRGLPKPQLHPLKIRNRNGRPHRPRYVSCTICIRSGGVFIVPTDPRSYDLTIYGNTGVVIKERREALDLHQENRHTYNICTTVNAVIKKHLKQAIPCCSSHISWELRYAKKADCCVVTSYQYYCVCLLLGHKHSTSTNRTMSLRSLIYQLSIYLHYSSSIGERDDAFYDIRSGCLFLAAIKTLCDGVLLGNVSSGAVFSWLWIFLTPSYAL